MIESSPRLCRGYSDHNLTALEQGAMERRIDELEGRLAAINDKLSEVVNQFNDDKQKLKDETVLEFAQQKPCTSRSRRRSTKRV